MTANTVDAETAGRDEAEGDAWVRSITRARPARMESRLVCCAARPPNHCLCRRHPQTGVEFWKQSLELDVPEGRLMLLDAVVLLASQSSVAWQSVATPRAREHALAGNARFVAAAPLRDAMARQLQGVALLDSARSQMRVGQLGQVGQLDGGVKLQHVWRGARLRTPPELRAGGPALPFRLADGGVIVLGGRVLHVQLLVSASSAMLCDERGCRLVGHEGAAGPLPPPTLPALVSPLVVPPLPLPLLQPPQPPQQPQPQPSPLLSPPSPPPPPPPQQAAPEQPSPEAQAGAEVADVLLLLNAAAGLPQQPRQARAAAG